MNIAAKKKWLCILILLCTVCMLCSVCFLNFFRASAEEEEEYLVTRDTLPNEVSRDDYSAEFGSQEERGWTYWYKTRDEGAEWTKFSAEEYSADNKMYTHGAASVGHLSMVPSAGTMLKRTYTAEKDSLVRFMFVINAYNSDGNNVSVNVNYDGQIFRAEINGEKQPLQVLKLGVAGTEEELTNLLNECDKTAADYTEQEEILLVNDEKGAYIAYADIEVKAGESVDFILDPDGDADGFKGEWCDGANIFIKSFLSYYKAEGDTLSNGDVLDGTTFPTDFGTINYFRSPNYNGSEFGMPFPNPYYAQFGTTQGSNGWSYMFEDGGVEKISMIYDDSTKKWVAEDQTKYGTADQMYISATESLANAGRPVIRAYKAEKAGIIRFVGVVQNGYFEATDPATFDGQKFYIKNEAGEKIPFVYGSLPYYADGTEQANSVPAPDSVTYSAAENDEIFLPPNDTDAHKYNDVYHFIVEVSVEKGEMIYFYDDSIGNNWCDKMYLGIVPIYTWVDPDDAIGPEEFTPDTVFSDLYDQGFGSTQNTNSWYYLFGDTETDYFRQVMDNGSWKSGFGTENSLRTMTPAVGYDAIRAWRAENDGQVRILGLASRVETGGDGVTLSIYKKGAASAPLYTHTFASDEEGEQQIMVGDPGASDTYVNVEAGDVIFFVVKAGETDVSDALNTKFYVVYTTKGSQTSDAALGDKIPPYTEETILASQYAVADGTSQGSGNWYKFFGSADEYYQMRFDGTKWLTGYEGTIQNGVYTPSKKYQTINAYRAPSTGELKILGSVTKSAAGGDGVNVIVSKVNAEGKTELKKIELAADNTAKQSVSLSLQVTAGDLIFFAVDKVGKTDADALSMKLFAYYASVTETPELGDDLGDSEPPVKTIDEYTIDDIADETYTEYMTANFDEQGKNGWYYLYGIGDEYYEMRKDGNNWKGPSSDPYNIVEGPRGTAPGNVWDTIRAYQVPNDGYMRIFAHFNFWQGSAGDGVKVTIKNQTTGEVIYNEIFAGGPEWEAIHTFASDEFKVTRGDVLFFILNKYGENNQCDNVTMGLYPVYSIKTSNETEPVTGGIGAKEFDENAIPPETGGEGSESSSHVIAIPKPAGDTPEKGDGNVGLIVGICVGAVVVIGCAVTAVILIRKKKSKNN